MVIRLLKEDATMPEDRQFYNRVVLKIALMLNAVLLFLAVFPLPYGFTRFCVTRSV